MISAILKRHRPSDNRELLNFDPQRLESDDHKPIVRGSK